MNKSPLHFELIAKCSTSRARASLISLPHCSVRAPVFMPVGTKGAMKAITTDQLENLLDCDIILANTYHLGNQPGTEILNKAGGLHNFMKWNRALLTDSGGFQMVSLSKLSEVTEEGVRFKYPYDESYMLLTPEASINIQHSIGADIIMQLDDVVHSLTEGPRMEEAMLRSVRWLDRCIEQHKSHQHTQNLFAIVQGGLCESLRARCVGEMVKRDVAGFAIGGLSGGEDKSRFWRVVALCCQLLPADKPRYLMGVGFPVDLVVCTALGCDMFDCVYPTRTARFGTALVASGLVNLCHARNSGDCAELPIQEDCGCSTCTSYTRAQLNSMVGWSSVFCSLVTIHNLHYMINLMRAMRTAIIEDRFPRFVADFFKLQFPSGDYPAWTVDALSSVNIFLS